MNSSINTIPNSLSLNEKLSFRVSIAKLFQTTKKHFEMDYGGELIAYSFESVSVDDWFGKFRQQLLEAIGKKYLPVYRMADGEYRFLLGYKGNFHRSGLFKNILRFFKHKTIEVVLGPRFTTSWGEKYGSKEIMELRRRFIENLDELLRTGFLCAFLYENPKNANVHYNKHIISFFDKKVTTLDKPNLFPFHFPFFALSNDGWQEFIVNRKILIVTGNLENRKQVLENNLKELGAKKVGFYEISASSSLKDIVDKQNIENSEEFEIALVGAGIGSLNILLQMKWFAGPVIDVGGFITALQNKDYFYHGGAAKFPGSRY